MSFQTVVTVARIIVAWSRADRSKDGTITLLRVMLEVCRESYALTPDLLSAAFSFVDKLEQRVVGESTTTTDDTSDSPAPQVQCRHNDERVRNQLQFETLRWVAREIGRHKRGEGPFLTRHAFNEWAKGVRCTCTSCYRDTFVNERESAEWVRETTEQMDQNAREARARIEDAIRNAKRKKDEEKPS